MWSRLRLSSLALLLLATFAAQAQGPAFPYSVALTWTLSTSAGITGQNVYRAPYAGMCGTFAKLTATPIGATLTSYSDTTVVPNSVYCYEVTAISSAGESGPSNLQQNIQIPPAPDTNLAAVTN